MPEGIEYGLKWIKVCVCVGMRACAKSPLFQLLSHH